MTLLIGSDLDRTLIYSRAAFDIAPGLPDPATVCVERLDGAPLSFVTVTAHSMIAQLADSDLLVPVTSRTLEQYQRIELPGRRPTFVICANGGRLLVDGVEDQDYRAELEADLAETTAPLAYVWALLLAAAGQRERLGNPLKSIRRADESFCYAVDFLEVDSAWVAELEATVEPLGWGVTRQLRKVYIVPRPLNKLRALSEVAVRIGATRVVAAGDAHLDTSILEYADAAIRPAHGELHDEGWTTPGLHITLTRGIAAGEEVAGWMLEQRA